MALFINIARKFFFFFNEVSLYLLFGFFLAGILHLFFSESLIRRHLGHDSTGSIVKATLFGIPLPLCSCSAVPVGASLRNSGASKGATASFLIAAPQIGADSFMITYSLLGWVFGLFRIIASLATALIAGIIINSIYRNASSEKKAIIPSENEQTESFSERLKSLFNYIEYDLLGSIANALIAGIIIAALITALVPDNFFVKYLGNNFLSMITMLIIGIPMYVCATASTPIAASLIMKGLSPGAALIFLLTGPATNAISFVTSLKILGKRATAVYFLTIAIVGLLMGYLLNIITTRFGFSNIILTSHAEIVPFWLKISGSTVLTAMLTWYYIKTKLLARKEKLSEITPKTFSFSVQGMNCMHCAHTVKKAVESVAGTSNIFVDLAHKNVKFTVKHLDDLEKVKAAIERKGYTV